MATALPDGIHASAPPMAAQLNLDLGNFEARSKALCYIPLPQLLYLEKNVCKYPKYEAVAVKSENIVLQGAMC